MVGLPCLKQYRGAQMYYNITYKKESYGIAIKPNLKPQTSILLLIPSKKPIHKTHINLSYV